MFTEYGYLYAYYAYWYLIIADLFIFQTNSSTYNHKYRSHLDISFIADWSIQIHFNSFFSQSVIPDELSDRDRPAFETFRFSWGLD